MRNFWNRLIALFLVTILLSGLGGALAVGTDYADIKGHWAEATLIRALNDTLIVGTRDSLSPNAPMTSGEILTILCRVLSAQKTADISGITDIRKDDVFYTIAAQAVALGIAAPVNGRLALSQPVTRSKAFIILAEAFQLYTANPDTSVLLNFSDGNTLSGRFRQAASCLISAGFVGGFNGSLHINDNISRAEFLTVLYKIIPNYVSDSKDLSTLSGGIVLTGSSSVSDTVFSGNVYFDCTASSVQLHNITAPGVILRSDSLDALWVSSSKIDRLVFSAGSGDLYFSPDFASSITTTVIGTGSGKLTFGGSLPTIEITGNNRDVTITGAVKNLLVSGSNNTVIIAPGATVDTVTLLGSGIGNTMSVNGFIGECTVFGQSTVISGTGTVQMLNDNASDSSITANTVNVTDNKDYGLNGVALTLTAPDNVPSYETLKASVSINAPKGSRLCRGSWYIDDVFISQSDISVGATSEVSLNLDIPNRSDAPVTSTLSFVLSYINGKDDYQEIRTDKSITLLNATKFDAAEVLALVKTGYQGNYTLAWAQANDYTDTAKTIWVNAKGYTSKTNYLVWVNIAYQRVNIFTGSAGNWTLTNNFIVGTGASGNDTPTGVFKIIGRSTRGWTTKTYTVKPVIFFLNSAYGFHSRLYDPGTTKINDARIGFPVSHGCVRMYDADVAWFYKNIPTGTTVVVY